MPFILSLSVLLTLNTLSAKFEREVVTHHYKEVVNGMVYYQAPAKAVIEVNNPINQFMIFDGKVMTIYYPNEKKAFQIKAKNPIAIPFVQGFIKVMKEDYGLTELGYTLTKHKTIGDTLYSYWKPPPQHKELLGTFVLGIVDSKLVYAEARTPKGQVAIKSFYKKHINFGGKYFPLEVYSKIYDKSDFAKEHVIYSDVRFNTTLPERILNLKVPASVPVKEIEW